MRFLKGNFLNSVWVIVFCLMISQALTLSADEPIRFSANELDDEKTHPIKLVIQVYKADRLPIGKSYVSNKQVVDSHAEHVADLDFSFHLESDLTVDDDKVKVTVKSNLSSPENLLNLDVDLALPDFREAKVRSKLDFKFQEELLQEFSSSTKENIVFVIVMKPVKLDWSREDKLRMEEETEEIENSKLRHEQEYKPRIVKLSREIGKVSIEERAAYANKFKATRKVVYKLVDPELRYIFDVGVSEVKSENENAAPVYDFSKYFGCSDRSKEQWVHYDSGTQVLTGNVDGFVDVRLREFALWNERMDTNLLRITAEIITVDVNAEETMENIKRLEKLGEIMCGQRVSQFSKSLYYGENNQQITVGDDRMKIYCGTERNDLAGIEFTFENEGKRKLKFSGDYPIGKDLVMPCGLFFGGNNKDKNKKDLIVMRIDKLAANDRLNKLIPTLDPFLQYTKMEPIAIPEINEDLIVDNKKTGFKRYKLADHFVDLINASSDEGPLLTLVTTPEYRIFDSSDVVYDIEKLLDLNGFILNDDDVWLFNQSKAELIYRTSREAELTLEELVLDLKRRAVPRSFKYRVDFYEVDNRQEHQQSWGIGMILRSNPISVGAAGVAGSGGVSNGEVMLNFLFNYEDEPDAWKFAMDVNLEFHGKKISETYGRNLIPGKTMFIEIMRGEKRSLVAVVVAELIE